MNFKLKIKMMPFKLYYEYLHLIFFRIVYNLCTLKYEPMQANLYDRYSKSIRQYLEENVA